MPNQINYRLPRGRRAALRVLIYLVLVSLNVPSATAPENAFKRIKPAANHLIDTITDIVIADILKQATRESPGYTDQG